METDLPMALTTVDPAPLHDARVDGRRLRAAVMLFQGLYPGAWEQAASMAREVTRCLRFSRDLDIRCARLRLLMRGVKRSDRHDGPHLGRMLDESAALRRSLSKAAGPSAGAMMAPLLERLWDPRVSEAPSAQRLVNVRLAELAQRTALLIPTAAIEPLGGIQHRLRIRGKALRYSLEMMEWRLGEEASWRIRVLQKAQDVLGELHDLDVFVGYLNEDGKGRGRGEHRVQRNILSVLGQQRHKWFERFLDLRPELEDACGPVAFRARERANP
jgi:CHAD domain-containing protein